MQPVNNYKLSEYSDRIKKTDSIENDLEAIALGVFGEVGSILSSAKKLKREGDVVYDFGSTVSEELGDALWYFCRLVDVLGFSIDEMTPDALDGSKPLSLLTTNIPDTPLARTTNSNETDVRNALPKLGKLAAELLDLPDGKERQREILKKFFSHYLDVVRASRVNFSAVIDQNLKKTEGRFVLGEMEDFPDFDKNYEEDERIPDSFEIEIVEKTNGKSYMKWRGVFIGDPLSDNIKEEDYYRFHDVFHMAHAAILHWSPTFRALIKHKRKSNPLIDEQQDSGRAIVIEEGLSAWIFSLAKSKNLFEGHDRLSFSMLKNIQTFVKGYEVERCPASLWEKAILDGYSVFRELVKNRSGVIIGDRKTRTIKYEPLRTKQ